ncbi:MAG: hypothetical protein EOR09_18210 [Mesorhizobium sp.]|nr:MAG: hypothetical protein EOR09_18210 [Mesorhizobium sp.]
MRGVPAWRKLSYTSAKSPTPHSVQHPSTVSALRADPPSPTRRGEGKEFSTPRWAHLQRLRRCQPAISRHRVAGVRRQPHE